MNKSSLAIAKVPEIVNPHLDKLITLKNKACFYPAYISTSKDFSMQIFLHCHNVAVISADIASSIGLIEEEVNLIYELALLHDAGKSKIPEKILYKDGKLTKDEFEIMKQHIIYSEEIYLNIMNNSNKSGVKRNGKVIRYHHESYDGSGYPDGLKGDFIPLYSRIISIADIFEAIIHPRVYRPYPVPEPMKVMKEILGKKIDNHILKSAYEVLNSYISY